MVSRQDRQCVRRVSPLTTARSAKRGRGKPRRLTGAHVPAGSGGTFAKPGRRAHPTAGVPRPAAPAPSIPRPAAPGWATRPASHGRPHPGGPHARLQLSHRLGMECASGLDEGTLSSRSLHWAPAVGSEERMKTHHREAAPSPGAQGQGRGFCPAGRPSERRAPALPQPRPLLSSQGRPLKLKRPCTDSKFQATASSTHQDSPRRMASRRCSPVSGRPEGSHLTSRDWRPPASLDV